MKEDSLYFGVFLKVVYNCIWKMTHLCIKLRKLKYQAPLAFFLQECYYDYTKKAPTPKWMLQVYSDIVLTDTAYPVGQTG